MHWPNLYQRRVIRQDGLSVRRIIRRPIRLLARLEDGLNLHLDGV